MLLVVIILNLLSSYLSLNSFFLLSFREFSSTGEHSLIIMHPLDLTTPSLVVGGCCNTNFPPPSYSYYILLSISRYSFSLFVLFCMKYVSLNLPQKQWLVHNLSFGCRVFEFGNIKICDQNHDLTCDLTGGWINLKLIRLVNNLSNGCGVFDGGIIKYMI